MLKWMTSLPVDRQWKRWLTLPDPETLLRLTAGRREDRGSDSFETFSRIVSTIWIDGINKRTRRNRLTSSLEAMRGSWRPASGREVLTFLDLGASDGLSTSEAAEFLRAEYHLPLRAVALDKYLTLHRHDRGWLREYRATNGDPVLLRCGPLGLRLGRRLALWPAEALRRLYLGLTAFRASMAIAISIPLVHPQALLDPDVHFQEGDLFAPRSELIGAFDVVRSSNLLNLGYFSAPDIRRALRQIHRCLRPQGLLIVSRNVIGEQGESEQGTLWRRSDDGFDVITEFGGGSEIQSLVARLAISGRPTGRGDCRPLPAQDPQIERECAAA